MQRQRPSLRDFWPWFPLPSLREGQTRPVQFGGAIRRAPHSCGGPRLASPIQPARWVLFFFFDIALLISYLLVGRDQRDAELVRAGQRMHELGNMANQAALEFQHLIRRAVWEEFRDFQQMGANDPAANSETRAELNRLAVHLKCNTDTAPRFSDLIDPAPYDPEASYATERAVKAWKIVESLPLLVSNPLPFPFL